MIHHVKPLVAALALCSPLHADIVAESRVFGERFAIRATDKQVQAAPKWTKDADNPPLSARRAIELATAMQKQVRLDKAGAEWKFESYETPAVRGRLLVLGGLVH